jgi:hypothetical protein
MAPQLAVAAPTTNPKNENNDFRNVTILVWRYGIFTFEYYL